MSLKQGRRPGLIYITKNGYRIDPFRFEEFITAERVEAAFDSGLVRSASARSCRTLFRAPEYLAIGRVWAVLVVAEKFRERVSLSEKEQGELEGRCLDCYVRIILEERLARVLEQAVFVLGYLIHQDIYEHLEELRNQQNLQFVFDVYKVIFREITGASLSNEFVQHQVRLVFSSRYLDYLELPQEPKKEHRVEERTYFGETLRFVRLAPEHSDIQEEFDRIIRKIENDRLRVLVSPQELTFRRVMDGVPSCESFKANQTSPKLARRLGLASPPAKARPKEARLKTDPRLAATKKPPPTRQQRPPSPYLSDYAEAMGKCSQVRTQVLKNNRWLQRRRHHIYLQLNPTRQIIPFQQSGEESADPPASQKESESEAEPSEDGEQEDAPIPQEPIVPVVWTRRKNTMMPPLGMRDQSYYSPISGAEPQLPTKSCFLTTKVYLRGIAAQHEDRRELKKSNEYSRALRQVERLVKNSKKEILEIKRFKTGR